MNKIESCLFKEPVKKNNWQQTKNEIERILKLGIEIFEEVIFYAEVEGGSNYQAVVYCKAKDLENNKKAAAIVKGDEDFDEGRLSTLLACNPQWMRSRGPLFTSFGFDSGGKLWTNNESNSPCYFESCCEFVTELFSEI